MMDRTREFLTRARRLPAIPEVVMRLMELCNRADASSRDIAALVQREPTVSVRLLKLANSPFYGVRGQVATAHRAVILLGVRTVSSMAVVVWTHTICLNGRERSMQPVYQELFEHGLLVAVLARAMVYRLAPADAETAFQAGLLHDIGRVVLCAELGSDYRDDVLRESTGSRDALRRERRLLRFDHASLGAELMRRWGLPGSICAGAASHHDEGGPALDHPIAAAVGAADALARAGGCDLVAPDREGPPKERLARWGLSDPGSLDLFLAAARSHVGDLLGSMMS